GGLAALAAVALVAGALDVAADRHARRAAEALAVGDGAAAAEATAAAVRLRPDVVRLHLLDARARVADRPGVRAGLAAVHEALAISPGGPPAPPPRARRPHRPPGAGPAARRPGRGDPGAPPRRRGPDRARPPARRRPPRLGAVAAGRGRRGPRRRRRGGRGRGGAGRRAAPGPRRWNLNRAGGVYRSWT